MLNFNQLYYFYRTVQAGSVTSGAKSLRIAQPSLSAQIKTLERSLGRKLFVRDGRGLKLTSDGEHIFGQCRKIYEAGEALEHMLKTGQAETQRIHVGVSTEVERPFLVEVVRSLLKTHSHDSAPMITMTSEPHEAILGHIKSRTMDIAIVNEPVFDPEMVMLAEVRMPVVLAFHSRGRYQRLSRSRSHDLRTLSQLQELRWSLPRRGMRLRKETDHIFERRRVEARVAFESDVLATIVRSVLDDLGVALLPLHYIRQHVQERTISILGPKDGYWKHGLWLTCRRQEQESPAARSMTGAFLKVLSRTNRVSWD